MSQPAPTAGPAPPRWRRLHVSAGAAFLATAAQTVFGLVTYGYLVRVVGAGQVGIWVSLLAAGMLACLADLGLNHALIRQLSLATTGAQGSADLPAQRTIETIMATVAVATAIALALAWLSFAWWGHWIPSTAASGQTRDWIGYVFVGLWLNRVADALAAALDGLQCFVERSLASFGALLVGLLLTVALVPHWGMQGFALAFVAQNGLLVAAFGAGLHQFSPGLRWLRPRFHAAVLREALRYGLSVQFLIMCFLVIESAVKLSLARSGKLPEVAYFDLAFRIGKGVRGLLASALRVLVPRLAPVGTDTGGQDRRDQAYARSFEVLLLFSLPIFASLVAAAPWLSLLLVGRPEPAFVFALATSLLAWLGYSLTDPAMNLSLSSGRMGWPVVGHVLTLALVLCAVGLGGPAIQGEGYTLGLYVLLTLAILAGCGVTLIGIHHTERSGWHLLRPLPTLAALAGALALGLSGLWVDTFASAWPPAARFVLIAAAAAGYAALLWWLTPAGSQIWRVLAPRSMRTPLAASQPGSAEPDHPLIPTASKRGH